MQEYVQHSQDLIPTPLPHLAPPESLCPNLPEVGWPLPPPPTPDARRPQPQTGDSHVLQEPVSHQKQEPVLKEQVLKEQVLQELVPQQEQELQE